MLTRARFEAKGPDEVAVYQELHRQADETAKAHPHDKGWLYDIEIQLAKSGHWGRLTMTRGNDQ